MHIDIDIDSIAAEHIPSPALLFFRRSIEENIRTIVKTAGSPGRLRPHIKTHKCPEIINLKLKAGITKFKCATLAEAGMLAAAGAPDVLIAYQLVGPNVDLLIRLIKAHPDTVFSCLVDHAGVLAALSEAAVRSGTEIPVFIDIDVGMHRTGIHADEKAVDLYRAITEAPGIISAGIHAYDGHHHAEDTTVRERDAAETVKTVRRLEELLTAAGSSVDEIVMSGTPMFPFYARHPGLSLSPGTLILQDSKTIGRYPDLPYLPGALILSRVISIPQSGAFTLDAGAKAVSVDNPDKAVLLTRPDAVPGDMSEEHWQYACTPGSEPEIGDPMLLMPAHVCTAVHHYDRAYVIREDGTCSETWTIGARSRVIPDTVSP